MLKKIGISLLLACMMLVSTVHANPTPACRTIAECRELQRTARDNIAVIIEQEGELSDDITEVQAEISTLRDEITHLENTIRTLDSEIIELDAEIADLAYAATINLEILDITADQIDDLVDQISARMRLAQRANNRNSFLVMLSEAEDLTTFLRVTRGFNRIATDDAELMDELTSLVEFQENLLLELSQQQERLETRREARYTRAAELAAEQVSLEAAQYALMIHEAEMRAIYHRLNRDRISEEQILAMAAEIEEILERIPPPLIVAPDPPAATDQTSNDSTANSNNLPSTDSTSNNNNSSANNSTANSDNSSSTDSSSTDSTSNNNASSNTPPANNNTPPPNNDSTSNNNNPSSNNETSNSPSSNNNSSSSSVEQTPPANSGLAHPMPGARVTSEFGRRNGAHHAGIDLAVVGDPRAPILAAAYGTVIIAEWHNSMGWYVVISHNINGNRVDTLYAHMRYSPPVSPGDAVTQGQVIGTKGNTGNSFGAHLHFEVHPGGFAWVQNRGVNPRGWINF